MIEEDEDDKMELDRLNGSNAEIRNKASSLQSELNQQRKVNEDLARQLDEARKTREVVSGNEELVAQLHRKDEEIEALKKENLALVDVSWMNNTLLKIYLNIKESRTPCSTKQEINK
jgi:hypothetical protein